MENIVKKLKFKGQWRNYQERVLGQLRNHFEDKRLHVVAAPGAGKTILGLEVIKRLGQPALILSPTIVIKNQWKDRLVQNFLPNDISPDEVSSDLVDVKSVTSGTYQRLHAIYKKNLLDEFVNQLKLCGVKTLVLDEAHHLRTEWYKTLDILIEKLSIDTPEFRIVSLTATPPYDVEEKEWNNYYNLCGPIDAEISIPELVKNKNLCPHQDLIYFSDLNEEEKKIIFDFKKNREEFFKYINKSSDLLYAIETSVFVSDFENNYDLIYEDTDFTISLISYLFSIDTTHIRATYLMNFLELKKEVIPEFTYNIAEDLFNGMLGKYRKYFKNIPTLKSKIKEYGLLKNASKVDFEGETNFKKLFARSQNKLKSIEAITRAEYNILGEKLREVILLDYIGKDAGAYGLNIISAFNLLNKHKPKELKLAILTGTIVIIPKSSKELFDKLIEEKAFVGKILCADYNEDYLRVESYGEVDVVALITVFFAQGGANVLLGTHSLLGEGWDSPCINTLIIGSVVASFMLSNQMRGRALRVDKNNPDKTANIWHLLAVESEFDKGFDFNTISRRFDTFDGISYINNAIESGFERLGLEYSDYSAQKMELLNQKSLERAIARKSLPTKWDKCLKGGKLLPKKGGQVYQGLSIEETKSEVNSGTNTKAFISSWNGILKLIFDPLSVLGIFCITFTVIFAIHWLPFTGNLLEVLYTKIASGGLLGIILTCIVGAFLTDGFGRTERLKNKTEFYITAPDKIKLPHECFTLLFFMAATLMAIPFLGGRALGLFVGVLFVFLIHLQVALKYDVDLIFSPLFLSTAHFVILPSILFAIALAPLLVSLWGISHEGAFGFSLGVAILLFPVIYKITMNFKAHVLIPIKERIYSIIYRIKFKLSVYPPYVYIADALLKTLCKMGIIQTPYWVIEISFENNVLKLLNATRKEQDSFRNILAEVFKKTKNEPKYILKLTKQKDKNILPPYILKREDAEFFAKQLEKKFGKIEVVGVRSLMGKRELLKARYNDFVRAKAKNQRTWGV